MIGGTGRLWRIEYIDVDVGGERQFRVTVPPDYAVFDMAFMDELVRPMEEFESTMREAEEIPSSMMKRPKYSAAEEEQLRRDAEALRNKGVY